MRYYTGVGTRHTTDAVDDMLSAYAKTLAMMGFKLRSGRAPGSDLAFERGSLGYAELYIPWASFQEGIPVRNEAEVITT